jgi:hypothetical protein
LRDRPERSRSEQRYRNRQPIVERRDEHLLLDPRPGVGKQPEVQCVRRSWKSLLCGEADSVSFTVRGGLFGSTINHVVTAPAMPHADAAVQGVLPHAKGLSIKWNRVYNKYTRVDASHRSTLCDESARRESDECCAELLTP